VRERERERERAGKTARMDTRMTAATKLRAGCRYRNCEHKRANLSRALRRRGYLTRASFISGTPLPRMRVMPIRRPSHVRFTRMDETNPESGGLEVRSYASPFSIDSAETAERSGEIALPLARKWTSAATRASGARSQREERADGTTSVF
jgi:hypothetical protein